MIEGTKQLPKALLAKIIDDYDPWEEANAVASYVFGNDLEHDQKLINDLRPICQCLQCRELWNMQVAQIAEGWKKPFD